MFNRCLARYNWLMLLLAGRSLLSNWLARWLLAIAGLLLAVSFDKQVKLPRLFEQVSRLEEFWGSVVGNFCLFCC